MKKYPLSFSALLPLLDLACWVALLLVPTLLVYLRLKLGVHGSAGNGSAVIVPPEYFLGFALQKAAWGAHGILTILNAPASIGEVVVALLVSHTTSWEPNSMAPSLWRSLTYPFYALPAWWYVGRGIDGMLGRLRLSAADMLVAASLSLFSLAISTGLRFGLSTEERLGQDQINWFITGFAVWTVLFAVPLVGWLLQRGNSQPQQAGADHPVE